MKTKSSEKPRIAEDKRAFGLPENQVVMLLRAEGGRFDAQRAAHAKMQSEPVAARKTKEHLLPARDRFRQAGAGEMCTQGARVAAAKDPFPRVQFHRQNFRAHPRIPLLPIEFDLREFRHDSVYAIL